MYLDLQNLARRMGRNTQELLQLYALEGFLARLSITEHVSQLVLKGGVLLAAYGTRRTTRDVDFQGRWITNEMEAVLSLVRDISSVELDDGLVFEHEAAMACTIRDGDQYHGIRVSMVTQLATARVGFHVDVNVGDPIWPAPQRITLPGILGRGIELIGYPLSMIYAEKIVTAIDRLQANTRWRDFVDVYSLSGLHPVEADEVAAAIQRVAAYRGVKLVPLAKALEGWAESTQATWLRWHRRQQLPESVPTDFATVVGAVAAFAGPILTGKAEGSVWQPASRAWFNQALN